MVKKFKEKSNMKIKLFKQFRRILILTALMASFSILNAGSGGKVVSVTMSPATANFGDLVTITVTYCAQLYNSEYIAIAISSSPTKSSADLSANGQIFVVSVQGVDVATALPDGGNPGGPIGWLANANPNGGASNCQDCSPQAGNLFTNTYNVHIPPASDFPGCNISQLYIHVALKDANMNAPDWLSAGDTGACNAEPVPVDWTMGTQPKGFTMSKTTEGEVQAQGDLVLYSINYTYWNGQLTLTDTIPGGGDLQLVSFGPAGMTGGTVTGPAIGSTSGNFSWALPDRTGMPGTAAGTVWMLYKETQNPPTAGKDYANSATGTMAGVANQNAHADCIVGQAAISIIKSQSEANPAIGAVITYYLNYNVNGMQLVAYQSFDDLATDVYGSMAGETGAPPTGWQFTPQNGVNGDWTISDACNTGDRIITGQVDTASTYPGLLYQGISGNKLCSGIVYGEAYINPGTYEGADALMFFRNNGLVGGNAYALVISVDKNIGGYTGGNIDFQACVPGCIWPTPTIIGANPAITSNKWWCMQVWIDPANQYHFQAKAWPRGSPAPAGYQIDWTDPNGAAEGMNCNSGTNWMAGFGEQGGDVSSGWVQDSYNNFEVFNPRVSASTIVWDTIPNAVAGASDGSVLFVGQQGPYAAVSTGPNIVSWNLGNISNETGTFTWWGTVNSCNPITNQSFINGAAPEVAQASNIVVAIPICPTPVIELIKTANVTTAKVGDTVTFTLSACNYSTTTTTINPFTIWDTIPTCITYIGATGTFTKAGSLLNWNFPALTPGGATPTGAACTGNVTWYGTINSAAGCMINLRDYFANYPMHRKIVADSNCKNGNIGQ
jgi:uncharacterized repeat protein (TIGR01451 family)